MSDSMDVDGALADLALLAVATLKVQMTSAKNPKDRIAAANSILDRLGYSRTPRVQADVADREIRRAMKAAKETGVSAETARGLEQLAEEEREALAPKPKKLTKSEQISIDQQEYDAAKAAEDAKVEAQWEAAAPEPESEPEVRIDMLDAAARWARGEVEEDELANARDISELGDDGEETDSWLNA